MKINAVKGFRDVLPGETEVWRRLEEEARRLFDRYGYSEIRIPIVERTELFARSAGETSDIVEKQMYTFEDVDGTSLTLRPEGTASVARAYIENGLYGREPVSKLFYLGPMFRRERPQKGRLRQFHQIGAEVLGRDDPLVDAELLVLLAEYFSSLGLATAHIELNSLGDANCRPAYREELRRWALAHRDILCADCNRRLEKNPLRILDCKEDAEKTRDAPLIADHLCAPCAEHFRAVRAHLDAESVSVTINPRMVRGLDYYCRTAFEIVAEGLGAQNAIGGGGRYDGLVSSLDGPAVAGVGFALGIERLMLALHGAEAASGFDLFIAPLGERAEARAFHLARELRRLGLRLEIEPGRKSLKSHMRRADKLGAAHVLIVGDDELARGTIMLRNLRSQSQVEMPLDAAAIARAVREEL
ncbi:MAG TPA: histidine--tRNA ligase [Candidatus Binatia bacterium]|nr:histidine--tRNA ligase [Candidatus Binatia bacterium]